MPVRAPFALTISYNSLCDDYEHRVLYPRRHPHSDSSCIMVGAIMASFPDVSPRNSRFLSSLARFLVTVFVTIGAAKNRIGVPLPYPYLLDHGPPLLPETDNHSNIPKGVGFLR
jgi:hypothetical protein